MKLSNILLVVGCVGIAVAGAGLVLDRLYPPKLYFTELPREAVRTAFSTPQRILVPDLAIDLTIEPGDVVSGQWTISPSAANHLQTSARPGSSGNVVLYGHDSRDVLGPLKQAQIGQQIIVYDAIGKAHVYRIETMRAVLPTDVSSIQPTDEETLTVYTCAGLFNEQRLIVRAKPVTTG